VFKNVASQKVAVFAWDNAAGAAKTGDAANISAQISKDGAATAATDDVAPTELDSTDAPGIYIFDMTQAETNADLVVIAPVSSTGDIVLRSVILYTKPVTKLTSGTAAINTTAESFTKAGAEPETNTYTSTVALDGTYHIVEDDATATDCYYQFDIGGNGVPVSIAWQGYARSQGDSYTIWAYNYVTPVYEQIGTVNAVAGTNLMEETFSLTNVHVGTGANIGKVRFRFLSADGTAFATDRVLCSYSIVTKSIGYANGAIWINTNGSNTNTEDYVDGTADKPVSTWAAALTLNTSLKLNRFEIAANSTITLTASSDNYAFFGWEWTLVLDGQSIAGAYVNGAVVTGTGTGVGARFFFCKMAQGAGLSIESCGMKDCALGSSGITFSATGTYLMNGCFSSNADTYIDFEDANENKNVYNSAFMGDLELRNFGHATGVHKLVLTGQGHITFNANSDDANADDIIDIHGMFCKTDNVSGGWGGTTIEDAMICTDQITKYGRGLTVGQFLALK